MITAYLGTLNSAMDHIGAQYPAPVAQAIADRDRLRDAVQAMPPVSRYDATEAATVALLEGRDPFTDETVLRLGIASILMNSELGFQHTIARHSEQRIGNALTEHAAAVSQILHDAAATAGDELLDAHQILGDVDLSDSTPILALGPAAAEAWATAQRAVKTVRTLEAGWVALATLGQHANPGTLGIYRLADTSYETRCQLGTKPDPWDLIRAGEEIDLALDSDDIRAREARHNAEREGHTVAADAAGAAALRSRYGFTPA